MGFIDKTVAKYLDGEYNIHLDEDIVKLRSDVYDELVADCRLTYHEAESMEDAVFSLYSELRSENDVVSYLEALSGHIVDYSNAPESIDEIGREYDRGKYTPAMLETKYKLSKNHIEDETQSVIWNREYVAQYNESIDQLRSVNGILRDLCMSLLCADVEHVVKNELEVSDKTANIIVNACMSSSDSILEFLDKVEEHIELLREVLAEERSKEDV